MEIAAICFGVKATREALRIHLTYLLEQNDEEKFSRLNLIHNYFTMLETFYDAGR